MPLPGVSFTATQPSAPKAASRADIALFAGLVARTSEQLSQTELLALEQSAPAAVSKGGLGQDLLGVPVRIESWNAFERLFDWTSRSSQTELNDRVPTALGLAVRQFFEEGGTTAYIVRCGDPASLSEPELEDAEFRASRLEILARGAGGDIPILPGLAGQSTRADPTDPATWHGAAAIFEIEDVAMLVLPDLVDLCAPPLPEAPALAPTAYPPEQFRPCGEAADDPSDPTPAIAPIQYLAPRYDAQAYRLWSQAIAHALNMLGSPRGPAHRRDVMLLAALPLPQQNAELPTDIMRTPLPLLDREGYAGSEEHPLALFDSGAIGNARLQLGYPWLKSPAAGAMPEGVQAPDGALAGLIARSALEKGASRSAAGSRLRGQSKPYPSLELAHIQRSFERPAASSHHNPVNRADWLGDRLCLFASRGGQIELISDSTFSQDRVWRPGGVSRLMGIIQRASRRLGETLMFEPSGPALWRSCEARMRSILERLRGLDAFAGSSPAECYEVTCDRSTMSQADIDAGRVRCRVIINPAHPVERIEVNLALIEPVAASRSREAA